MQLTRRQRRASEEIAAFIRDFHRGQSQKLPGDNVDWMVRGGYVQFWQFTGSQERERLYGRLKLGRPRDGVGTFHPTSPLAAADLVEFEDLLSKYEIEFKDDALRELIERTGG